MSDHRTQPTLGSINAQIASRVATLEVQSAGETPHSVGAVGEPAFQNGWVNLAGGYQAARFWRDPMGMVHIEGALKDGTLSTVAFTLPAGYRPGAAILTSQASNLAAGYVQVNTNGDVLMGGGSNASYTIHITFRQEA